MSLCQVEDGWTQLCWNINQKNWAAASEWLDVADEEWASAAISSGVLQGSNALHLAAFSNDRFAPWWLNDFFEKLCRKAPA